VLKGGFPVRKCLGSFVFFHMTANATSIAIICGQQRKSSKN
jgi:hypothetical protein